MKKLGLLILLLSSNIIFAQKNDWQKNNLQSNPKIIEESNTKAIIRANLVEGYMQDYYTKTYYNTDGFIAKIENFSENGDLNTTDFYTYNDQQLILIERKNPEESFKITKEFAYVDNGYIETTKENGILIAEKIYMLDQNKNILSEQENNLIEETITSKRQNEYQNNKLVKTTVTYGNDGYIVNYKYSNAEIPAEEIVYDLKNKLVSKRLRKFDEKGHIIEENYFGSDAKLRTNNRILYEFDEKGNWIKRTQYANDIDTPISNTIRTFKY